MGSIISNQEYSQLELLSTSIMPCYSLLWFKVNDSLNGEFISCNALCPDLKFIFEKKRKIYFRHLILPYV